MPRTVDLVCYGSRVRARLKVKTYISTHSITHQVDATEQGVLWKGYMQLLWVLLWLNEVVVR